MPIVARLYRYGPQPFATMAANLSASRDTLTETLAKLEAVGVIERRRGGQKTIYALTPLGERVGENCGVLVDLLGESELLPVALKKWPMLVAVALGRGAKRYNEAKAKLPGITARALALALKDLHAAGLVERTIDNGYPPAPNYRLSPQGQELFGPLDDLCRSAEAALSATREAAPAG